MLKGQAVSAVMAVQDECGGSRSNPVISAGNGVITGSLIKEHFSYGDDFSPKVRKPYTITKQRERWTEEEHKKFLEALKLYGRAWRRIEEHVGSKTAVQIRSHAQKFFSKVERESSGTTTTPAEPIEIPPPRPKRKPTHPYPRKMVHPLNKEASTSRSLSPNLSISDNENQSPTSVLSVVCSTDSNTPNCSLSPVSCPANSEINLTHEDNGSRSTALTINAAYDERSPKKLDLFPKDGLVEETSTRSLKLFGRTVLITESHGESKWGHSPAVTSSWWALYGGLPYPLGPLPKQETVKVIWDSNEEFQEREIQKDRSSTGSNSGSLDEEENIDRNTIERSGSSNNCLKGFVPYKKRNNKTAALNNEEREEKHIRLCL